MDINVSSTYFLWALFNALHALLRVALMTAIMSPIFLFLAILTAMSEGRC